MGMPVKLSDNLVKLARKEAGAASRSITSQIEHWARLGRAVETALGHVDLLALKGANGNLQSAFPDPSQRRAIYTVLERVAATPNRSALAKAPVDPVSAGTATAAMDAETRRQMTQWLDHWTHVGPILQAERLEGLRQLDDAESARIARDLVWPMGTLGDHRGGDDAVGLEPMKDALRKLGPPR